MLLPLRIPVRALVADSNGWKRQRCVKVEVHVDIFRIGKQIHELHSHQIHKKCTCDQEYHQPDKSKSTTTTSANNIVLSKLLRLHYQHSGVDLKPSFFQQS